MKRNIIIENEVKKLLEKQKDLEKEKVEHNPWIKEDHSSEENVLFLLKTKYCRFD